MWWFLGSLGIVAIEASYVPQIVRLFRLRRADEVSLFFPSLNAFGRVLALAYSILSHQPVFIAGFMVGLVLRSTLLAQVIWYRHLAQRREGGADVRKGRSALGESLSTAPAGLPTSEVHP
jgi:uncharacterized protein with PQ loop repeat